MPEDLKGPAYQDPQRPLKTEDDRRAPNRQGGILALDIATVTGWCYLFPGNQPIFDHQRSGSVGCETGECLHRFENWLDGMLLKFRPRWVVYEAPFVAVPRARSGGNWDRNPGINVAVVRRLYSLCGTVDKICYQRSSLQDATLECRELDTNAWCRWFTGMKSWGGRENKKAATLQAAKVYGFTVNREGKPITEDEADALGQALYSESIFAPKTAHLRAIGPRRELQLIADA